MRRWDYWIVLGIVLLATPAFAEVSKFEREMMTEVQTQTAALGTEGGLASAYGTCLMGARRMAGGFSWGFNKDRMAICDQIDVAFQKSMVGKGTSGYRWGRIRIDRAADRYHQRRYRTWRRR